MRTKYPLNTLRPSPCWSFVCFFTLLSILSTTCSAWRNNSAPSAPAKESARKIPSIGPLPFLLSSSCNFRWKASIDPKTGIASSEETSNCQWKQNYETYPESMRSVIRVSRQFIAQYPQWLARPKVSFGLLTAKTNPDTRETTLRPRFLPNLPLLTFGPMEVMGSPKKPLYQYKLPITGGILALASDNSGAKSGSRFKDMGCLLFESKSSSVSQSSKGSLPEIACTCTSQIAGAYRPWIAGGSRNNPIRPRAYLGSQSIVHAYVMWRFHEAWTRRLKVVS